MVQGPLLLPCLEKATTSPVFRINGMAPPRFFIYLRVHTSHTTESATRRALHLIGRIRILDPDSGIEREDYYVVNQQFEAVLRTLKG